MKGHGPDEDHSNHDHGDDHNHETDHGDGLSMSMNPLAAEIAHELHLDNSGTGGHMMMMYFHGGYNEVILFDFWRINSVGGLIGSMIVCFFLGILYEAIKFSRGWILRKFEGPNSHASSTFGDTTVHPSEKEAVVTERNNHHHHEQQPTAVVGVNAAAPPITVRPPSMFAKSHLILTLIHLVQIVLAYFLMLIFMTYNSWLCLATALGAMFGYFFFGWQRSVILDVSDHCQ